MRPPRLGLLCLLALAPLALPAPASASIRAAFYYPWFPETRVGGVISHWHPVLGRYDSSSPSVIDRHIRWMRYGRIQAGISSWWGPGTRTDQRFPLLLQGAARTGGRFAWTIYYEGEGAPDAKAVPGAPNPSAAQIGADLDYIKRRYASDPAYLKVGARPVIFAYGDRSDSCATADRWRRANASRGFYVVLKVFHGYRSCASRPDAWHQYGPASSFHHQGSVSVSPGFWKADERRPRLPRSETQWAKAVRRMVATKAFWQLVTTFNEWGEGTAVEPAREWAAGRSDPGRYLRILRRNGRI